MASNDQHPPDGGANVDEQEVPKKFERLTPPEQQDPALRFSRAKSDSAAHGDWGSGEAGYKPPTTPGERMRKNLPYKVMLLYVNRTSIDTGPYAVQIPPELG